LLVTPAAHYGSCSDDVLLISDCVRRGAYPHVLSLQRTKSSIPGIYIQTPVEQIQYYMIVAVRDSYSLDQQGRCSVCRTPFALCLCIMRPAAAGSHAVC